MPHKYINMLPHSCSWLRGYVAIAVVGCGLVTVLWF